MTQCLQNSTEPAVHSAELSISQSHDHDESDDWAKIWLLRRVLCSLGIRTVSDKVQLVDPIGLIPYDKW